jgi:hypothetical protein
VVDNVLTLWTNVMTDVHDQVYQVANNTLTIALDQFSRLIIPAASIYTLERLGTLLMHYTGTPASRALFDGATGALVQSGTPVPSRLTVVEQEEMPITVRYWDRLNIQHDYEQEVNEDVPLVEVTGDLSNCTLSVPLPYLSTNDTVFTNQTTVYTANGSPPTFVFSNLISNGTIFLSDI